MVRSDLGLQAMTSHREQLARLREPIPLSDVLRPTERPALLIQALHLRADVVRGKRAFEVGIGSGVVLRALAELGAAKVGGVDIEPCAVRRSKAILANLPEAVVGP